MTSVLVGLGLVLGMLTLATDPAAAAVPTIFSQPTNKTVSVGASATFASSSFTSPAPTAKYQTSTDGGGTWTAGTSVPVTGGSGFTPWSASTSIVGTTTNDNLLIRFVFTNTDGSVTSQAARLNVSFPPQITLNPVSQTVDPGPVTFTSSAIGGPAPTVQWQTMAPGGSTWADIAGATSATYTTTVTGADEGRQYRANWSNTPYGATLTLVSTSAATLHVNHAPVITLSPVDKFAVANASVSLTAAADASPAATVQWQRSTNGGSTWTNVTGATATTFTFTATSSLNGARHRAVFTNAFGSATSASSLLTIGTAPSYITIPKSQTLAVGDTATFTITYSGNPAPTIEWQRMDAGATTFTTIPGETSPSLSVVVDATMNKTKFQSVLRNSVGTAYAQATLTLVGAPTIVTQPVAAQVDLGSEASFSVAYTGGTDPVTVQWQRRLSSAYPWADVAGATDTTYTFVPTLSSDGYSYRAVVSSPTGGAISSQASLKVISPPVITTSPRDTTSSYPANTATFVVGAYGSGVMSYQWQQSADGGSTWTVLPATGTSNSYTVTNITDAMEGWLYRAVVTNTYGSATSDAGRLRVSWPPAISTQPTNQTAVLGNDATFSVGATGYPLSYQWQRGTFVGFLTLSWSNIPGATSSTYTFTPTADDQGSLFHVIVMNSYGTVTSNMVQLSVHRPPTITTNPTSRTVYAGTSTTFNASGSANPAASIAWERSNDGGESWATIAGATSSSYTISRVETTDDGARFRAVYTNYLGSATTTAAGLTVLESQPMITGSASPAPNAAGWNKTDVTVTWACTDRTGTGLASCPETQTIATEGPAQDIVGTVVDNAGQSTSAHLTLSIDKTAPTITAGYDAAPASGWYRGPVPVTFSCEDPNGAAASGVATCSSGATLTGDGAHRVLTGTTTDVAGNSASAVVDVAIDATAPKITGVLVPVGTSDVRLDWTCTDATSGIVECPEDQTVPANSRLAVLGRAVDAAGNTAEAMLVTSHSVYGEPVVLDAKTDLGATGTMTFQSNGVTLTTKSVSQGAASITTTKLTPGRDDIRVYYQKTSTDQAVLVATWTHEVLPASTTTSLTATNEASVGQAVTLTATVASVAPSVVVPTGTVEFTDGTTTIATKSLSGGVATLKVVLEGGPHSWKARMVSSPGFSTSSSGAVARDVPPAGSSVVVTSSLNPAPLGQSVSLKAKVSPIAPAAGTPTGAVSFYDGLTLLGTKTLSSGVATLAVKPLVGRHSITAAYSGAPAYVASTSPAFEQVIDRGAVAVTITPPSTTIFGATTGSLTIKVAPVLTTTVVPSGTVDLYDGGVLVATLPLTSGKATYSLKLLAKGTHTLSAVYNGDGSFLPGATTADFVQTIT